MSKATRARAPFAYSAVAAGATWSFSLALAATFVRRCFLELAQPLLAAEPTKGWPLRLDESEQARLELYARAIDWSSHIVVFAGLAGLACFFVWLTRVRALASALWPPSTKIPASAALVGAYLVPLLQAWWPYRHLQALFSLSDPAEVRLTRAGPASYRASGVAEVPVKHTEGISWIRLMWTALLGRVGLALLGAFLPAGPWPELARDHEPFYRALGIAMTVLSLVLLASTIRLVGAITSRQLEQLERVREGGKSPRALAEAERARSSKRAKKRKAPADQVGVLSAPPDSGLMVG